MIHTEWILIWLVGFITSAPICLTAGFIFGRLGRPDAKISKIDKAVKIIKLALYPILIVYGWLMGIVCQGLLTW
jgi:hypothetical protein